MKKVVSDAQRLANAANAQHSTGPRTPEGKASSSRNALKHALLSRSLVLDGPRSPESQADFDAFFEDLLREFHPQGVLEETLVQRVASCCWRMARAQRFETGSLREALETPMDTQRDVRRCERALAAARKQLDVYTRFQELTDKSQRNSDETEELNRLCAELASLPFVRAALPTDRPTSDDLARAILLDEQRCRLRFEQCAEALRQAQRDHELSTERRPLTLALPKNDDLTRVVRYENMLDRQLHRALTELRKLQSARAQKKVDESNPSESTTETKNPSQDRSK